MKTQLLAVGLAFLFAPAAMAQTADELAKGATDTNNVLNYGMGYDLQPLQPAQADQQGQRQAPGPGLELQLRRQPQRGIPAAGLQRRALRHHQQRHDGGRRQDRQANLEDQGRISAGDAAHRLLRHHQPRRRDLRRQDLPHHARRQRHRARRARPARSCGARTRSTSRPATR